MSLKAWAHKVISREAAERPPEHDLNRGVQFPLNTGISQKVQNWPLGTPVFSSPAAAWLHAKLTVPQRIAPLVAEWVGTMDTPTGRSIDALMEARWALRVEAYEGEDSRLWWRLPAETVQ